jgi:hypothetical protein
VTVLRRRSSSAAVQSEEDEAPAATSQAAKQAGKGKPTPKRSEVERARRQPYAAPPADKAGRKAASAQDRDRRRADMAKRTEAMKRGEEWAIPPKDRGPARALARDYIDSRRFIVSEYILFGVFLLIFVIFALGSRKNSSIVLLIELAILAVIVIESLFHTARVSRLLKQRLPDDKIKGMTWYIAKRSLRLRASRMPPPRVQRGDPI